MTVWQLDTASGPAEPTEEDDAGATLLPSEQVYTDLDQLEATTRALAETVDDESERSKRELEAEAVAYIVGRYYGLDTSGSAFYLAAWESDDPEVVRDRLDRISRTAEELIEVLED